MKNIFEKSFALQNMDEPIEKILIATKNSNIALAQTRKHLSIWDIRYSFFLILLKSLSFNFQKSTKLI